MLRKSILIVSLILSGCAGALPEFPDTTPVLIIPGLGVGMQCRLVDKDQMLFKCDEKTLPLTDPSLDLDGAFCLPNSQFKQVLNWIKEAKRVVENNCKGK